MAETSGKCPACGAQVPANSRWCPRCGRDLLAGPGGPGHGGNPQVPFGAGGAKGQLMESIRARVQTDEILSIMWIFLPIIASIAAVIGIAIGVMFLVVGWWVGAALVVWAGVIIALVVATVLFALLNYRLINRQNQHMRREEVLRGTLIEYIKSHSHEKNLTQLLSSQISTMESIQYDAKSRERETSAVLFAILIVIPVVGWIFLLYVLYVLTEFPYQHDRRWHAYTQQAQSAASHLGMTVILPSWKTLPDRSYIIYLVLTLLTGGLFLIYWYYVLIKDMNNHFNAQWQFEDQIAAQLK
ncbi:MAG: zinc ribbon domain-containing protein [Methanomassiliicoccales archaeon]|nr:zinc ribbon domain-containing protein [Methanomassiliicoccales archaeon]